MKSLSIVLSVLLTPLMAVLPIQAEMAAPASVPTAPSALSSQNHALQIRLADAGNATVEASSSLQGYSIQVSDGAGLPVSDAAVALRLPEDGATGYFANGVHSAVSYTNAAGIAVFAQVNWGATLGVAAIRVTAVKGDLRAGALIEQTIVAHSAGAPALKAQAVSMNHPPVALPPVPGTPASVQTGAALAQTPVRSAENAPAPDPVVSIVNSGGGSHSGGNKKWIVLAVVAAGVGIGAALALSGKGGASAATANPILSIGTPTISVGH